VKFVKNNNSNSSERGTKHVFRVNLAQTRSAVPETFHTQTKKSQTALKQNLTQFTACGKDVADGQVCVKTSVFSNATVNSIP